MEKLLTAAKKEISVKEKEHSEKDMVITVLKKEIQILRLQLEGTHVNDSGTNKDLVEGYAKFAVPSSIDFTFDAVADNRSGFRMSYSFGDMKSSHLFYIHGWPFKIHFENDGYISLNYLGETIDPAHHFYVEVNLECLLGSEKCPFGFIGGAVTNTKMNCIEILDFRVSRKISQYMLEHTVTISANIAATPPTPLIILVPNKRSLRKQAINILTSSLDGQYMEDRALTMLNSGVGADCKFLVGPEGNQNIFVVQRFMLARASPVFEALLNNTLQDQEVITMPNIKPQVFRKLLEAVYCCKWKIESRDEAVQLCLAAHECRLMDVVECCVEYIWPTSPADLWEALDLVTQIQHDQLEEAVMEIVRKETKKVFASEQFKRISQASLVAIVKQYRLNVDSETRVFWAMIDWGKARCHETLSPCTARTVRMQVGDVLQHVRFLAMTLKEFTDCQTKFPILHLNEMFAVMERMKSIRGRTDGMKIYKLSPFSKARLKIGFSSATALQMFQDSTMQLC